MDLNTKVITAVKECPTLYKAKSNIVQRQHSWQQLAKQTKLQEPFLKSRWHFLCEQFKQSHQNNDYYFKYKNEMEFLRPFVELPKYKIKHALHEDATKYELKPEFVITEKDIEEDSDNEEYVFLEVETLEGNPGEGLESNENLESFNTKLIQEQLQVQYKTEAELECDNEKVLQEDSSERALQVVPTQAAISENSAASNTPQQPQELSAPTKSLKTVVTVQPALEAETKSEQPIEELAEGIQAQPTIESTVSTADAQIAVCKAAEAVGIEPNERAEEDIFGELVTAMLKRMPMDKRRNVKKEIMNLLLT